METGLIAIGAALAVGLSGLGVALGQSILSRTSIDILGKNPKLMGTLRIYTILGIALVESAVIYGIIIAIGILGSETITGMEAIGAGIAMGLTAFGAGYGEGKLVASALEAINRNPENKNNVLQFMILFLALIESTAIYGLFIASKIIG